MMTRVSKRILRKKKSIFMQLLESLIPPLTAAALLTIICKKPDPHFDNHEKGIKNIRFYDFPKSLGNILHYI